MRTILKPLSFLPALCLMYMIFTFSAQDGVTSSQISYKVSYQIVETGGKILGASFEPWEIDSLATRFHGVIRKLAHMTEYFALAVAVAFPLYVYGMHGILLMLCAGLICVAFSCGDEYHQSFVAGRGPSVRDVLIDSFGIFWGIVLVRIVGWTGRKTIFRPFNRKKKKQQAGNFHENDMPYGNVPYNNAPPYGNASYGNPPYNSVPPYGNAPYNSAPQYGSTPSYGNAPYGNAPYNGAPSYGNTPYNSVPPYGTAPYNSTPQYGNAYNNASQYGNAPQYRNAPERHVSDKLAEDMSLKKLVRDLKEQKNEVRDTPVKPAVSHAASRSKKDSEVEIDEIDLDD